MWQPYKIFHFEAGGWKLVYSHHPPEYCQCGRSYGSIEDGTEFRLRLEQEIKTVQQVIDWLNSPLLCKFCYYKNEIDLGNWAPRAVLEAFGLPVDYS